MSNRRPSIGKNDNQATSDIVVEADGTWRNVARSDRRSFDLRNLDWLENARERALGDLGAMRTYSELVAALDTICGLGAALAHGEDVTDRTATIYRAATGYKTEREDYRRVAIALASVAKHSDARWSELLGRQVDDTQLAGLVCRQLELERPDVARRLNAQPATVAEAVRLWRRGAGRPKKGEPTGSKYDALAKIIRLGGLGRVDGKTIEQVLKEHPLKKG